MGFFNFSKPLSQQKTHANKKTSNTDANNEFKQSTPKQIIDKSFQLIDDHVIMSNTPGYFFRLRFAISRHQHDHLPILGRYPNQVQQ